MNLRTIPPWIERNAVRILAYATAITFALFAGLSLWRYSVLGANGIDLGIYTQVLWNTAHGHPFAFTIHPHLYLGDHLELGLIHLAPFARAFGTVPTLLVAQALTLVSAGAFTYRLAMRFLPKIGALIAALLTLTIPFLASSALFEFHFLVFSIPALFGMILAYEERRPRIFLLCALGALLVREDLAPVVAAFGLLALLQRRGVRWWLPAIVLGTGWFIAALKVIAAISGYAQDKFLEYYRWLGDSPTSAARTLLTRPGVVLGHISQIGQLTFLLGTFGSVALLPFGSLLLLLPILPLFAQYILGRAGGITIETHYLVPFVPFLVWASLSTLHRVYTGAGRWAKLKDERLLVYMLAVAAVLYTSVTLGPLPKAVGPLVRRASDPAVSVRTQLVKNVPRDVPLAADFTFLASVAERTQLASLHYQYRGHRQLSAEPYEIPSNIRTAVWDFDNILLYQSLYDDVVVDGRDLGADRLKQFWVDRKQCVVAHGDTAAVTAECPDGAALPYVENPSPLAHTNDTKLNDSITLEGSSIDLVSEEWLGAQRTILPISVILKATQKPDATYNLLLTAKNSQGRNIWARVVPVANGLFPTRNWDAGTRVLTSYPLVVPPALANSTLSLQLVPSTLPVVLDSARSLKLIVPATAPVGERVDLGTVTE